MKTEIDLKERKIKKEEGIQSGLGPNKGSALSCSILIYLYLILITIFGHSFIPQWVCKSPIIMWFCSVLILTQLCLFPINKWNRACEIRTKAWFPPESQTGLARTQSLSACFLRQTQTLARAFSLFVVLIFLKTTLLYCKNCTN